MSPEFWLLTAFIVKHFVVDYPLQGPYQYLNKGIYGHPGGIYHALLHFIFTYFLLMAAPIFLSGGPATSMKIEGIAGGLALMEGVIHYHIDWAKVRIGAHFGWGPTTSDYFWWLLGVDQLLHYLTYVAIVILWFA